METIAATMKPQPVINAMHTATNAIAGVGKNQLQPVAVRNGGHTVTIHQHFNGNVSQSQLSRANNDLKKNVLKIMSDEQKRKQRVSYS
jgi:hypothetical protein